MDWRCDKCGIVITLSSNEFLVDDGLYLCPKCPGRLYKKMENKQVKTVTKEELEAYYQRTFAWLRSKEGRKTVENITKFEKGKKYVTQYGDVLTYEGTYCGINLFSNPMCPSDLIQQYTCKIVKEHEEKQEE